eukprot:4009368-Pyramimonas_sp.AAC.1
MRRVRGRIRGRALDVARAMGRPKDVMPRDVARGPPRNGQKERMGTSKETRHGTSYGTCHA